MYLREARLPDLGAENSGAKTEWEYGSIYPDNLPRWQHIFSPPPCLLTAISLVLTCATIQIDIISYESSTSIVGMGVVMLGHRPVQAVCSIKMCVLLSLTD